MKLTPAVSVRRATRRAAFTLLEVLVVVAILVILAGVASISVFRYMEDAKVGRAKNDMLTIKKAYETYYTQHQVWPDNQAEVIPLLEQGQNAFMSPWPNVFYQVQIQQQANPIDGQEIDRVIVTCQPPGKPMIVVPDIQAGR